MSRRGGWGWIFFWPIAPLIALASVLWVPVVAGMVAFWAVVLVAGAVRWIWRRGGHA